MTAALVQRDVHVHSPDEVDRTEVRVDSGMAGGPVIGRRRLVSRRVRKPAPRPVGGFERTVYAWIIGFAVLGQDRWVEAHASLHVPRAWFSSSTANRYP